jgi:hypothetical protein
VEDAHRFERLARAAGEQRIGGVLERLLKIALAAAPPRTVKLSTAGNASAGAGPCSVLGICRAIATPRSGVASPETRRYRLSHPSRVAFTPGVAVSM